jgi:nucleoside-diphosphate-sugar epimerase
MRVFITGATGFIGTAVVKELIGAGHRVIGLSRSEEKAPALAAAGAEVRLGTIDEPDRVAGYAAEADGVIHLAFNHDFSDFAGICETDRRVIAALGAALAGSGKPLVITSGTALAIPVDGAPATEDGPVMGAERNPRIASEEAALALIGNGVKVSVVRLPQVHDPRKQGLLTYVIATAREKGMLAYVGDGGNRWPGAHISDVARLYRLALERDATGARYHAVAEEGIPMRDIAGVVSARLNLPTKSITPAEAQVFYGWLAMFVGHDVPASSAWTRKTLGWMPSGPTMLEDLARLEIS